MKPLNSLPVFLLLIKPWQNHSQIVLGWQTMVLVAEGWKVCDLQTDSLSMKPEFPQSHNYAYIMTLVNAFFLFGIFRMLGLGFTSNILDAVTLQQAN